MKKGTFIVFGNMLRQFTRMAGIINDCIYYLPKPIVIQAGPNTEFFQGNSCVEKLFDYCDGDSFRNYIDSSEMIVCHGGVGAVSSAIQSGKVPAVIPRRAELNEHVDNHQIELLDLLIKNKIAIPVETQGALVHFINERKFLIPDEANISFFDHNSLCVHVLSYLRESIDS